MYKIKNLTYGEKNESIVGKTEEHLIYEDRVGRAKHRCKSGSCMQIYNLCYEELTKIYDSKKASTETLNSKVNLKIDVDSQIMVVNTNKSFWQDYL